MSSSDAVTAYAPFLALSVLPSWEQHESDFVADSELEAIENASSWSNNLGIIIREMYLPRVLRGRGPLDWAAELQSGQLGCFPSPVQSTTDDISVKSLRVALRSTNTTSPENSDSSQRRAQIVAAVRRLAGATLLARRAAIFTAMALPTAVLPPTVVQGDGEILFEWIWGDRHAFISIDDEGEVAYAYLRNGRFVPGQEDAQPGSVPNDLLHYLGHSIWHATRMSL